MPSTIPTNTTTARRNYHSAAKRVKSTNSARPATRARRRRSGGIRDEAPAIHPSAARSASTGRATAPALRAPAGSDPAAWGDDPGRPDDRRDSPGPALRPKGVSRQPARADFLLQADGTPLPAAAGRSAGAGAAGRAGPRRRSGTQGAYHRYERPHRGRPGVK